MRRCVVSLSSSFSSLLFRSSLTRSFPSLTCRRFSSRLPLLASSSSLGVSPLSFQSQLFRHNNDCVLSWTGTRMLSDKVELEEHEMDEGEFAKLAEEVLEELTIVFEEIADHLEDQAEMDVTNASGVVTFNTGETGTFVINKQTPNRQVWLSSPLSGPKRYRYDSETKKWVNTRDAHLLTELLRTELNSLLDLSLPPMPF